MTSDVQVDEDEARRFYAQNLRSFIPKEALTLDEILVATREEAVALRDRIERGENLRILAQQHTLRRMAIPDSGRFHLHWYQRKAHEALFAAAQGAAPGDLLGPIAVEVPVPPGGTASADRYYSVFRVVESTLGSGPKPFAEVATRAWAIVLRQKRDAAFLQFLGELRHQYEPQVKIHEENLKTLVQEKQ